MILETNNIKKEYVTARDKVVSITYTNKLTDKVISINNPDEFVIGYNIVTFWMRLEYFRMSDCKLYKIENSNMYFSYIDSLSREWFVTLFNSTDNDCIKSYVEISCKDEDVYLDSIEYQSIEMQDNHFRWSRPEAPKKAQIPKYWTTLGQPVYYNSFFMGTELPTADNRIIGNKISLKYYIGRKMDEFSNVYIAHNCVVGSAIGADLNASRKSFFDYVKTFARPYRFRLQYNSWYDNQLKINSKNIEECFRAVKKGVREGGLRDLDCYVVDDGWVDYKNPEFWAFDSKKFPNGFENESKLTKELNSTFGVWFGPRGGYTESLGYATKLKKLGYHINSRAAEICVADPQYISALADRMAFFMENYNVTYFKIDGFAIDRCNSKKHGHPVGGYQNLYFYNFEWEEWFKAFDKLRAVNKDVFLNITSHSNNSPWMLKHADAVWLNNASDMYYEGEGSNLDQCLNYRDGRYNDFYNVRQLQFPSAYLYNHEPCYGIRNFNPPAPSKFGKLVEYTGAEFEKYLYMCMMRGTGFIELYYSPSMMDDEKWKINAKVLTWAENNFSIINKSVYFGGIPLKGEVYGYFAYNEGQAIVCFRNPNSLKQVYTLNTKDYSHNENKFSCSNIYGTFDNLIIDNELIKIVLEPFEVIIVKLKYNEVV